MLQYSVEISNDIQSSVCMYITPFYLDSNALQNTIASSTDSTLKRDLLKQVLLYNHIVFPQLWAIRHYSEYYVRRQFLRVSFSSHPMPTPAYARYLYSRHDNAYAKVWRLRAVNGTVQETNALNIIKAVDVKASRAVYLNFCFGCSSTVYNRISSIPRAVYKIYAYIFFDRKKGVKNIYF